MYMGIIVIIIYKNQAIVNIYGRIKPNKQFLITHKMGEVSIEIPPIQNI